MIAERLCQAINNHDLDAFVDCFHQDYRSEQPAHPARAFHGREQVRRNWSVFFRTLPDLRAEILALAMAEADGVEWTEWRWQGNRENSTRFEMRGVMILGVQEERIAWARLYMEEVDAASEDIDSAVRNLTTPNPARGET
ncbi:nuclear transport factor 2 family protein [Streptomyces sp. ISL-36]|uniref:nuclear transport factor 2 family protein n=1 Tax=Streptomyces sp. ISL-36 TaxID=2819182 RepID=UPI001BE70B5C|nr:nuclear transport factor 2 family protein [Streptomyces sp. ISL-36]MBT2439990.1 nuclear transport factor 2 family protein [Streptomyces sp. ISL-36]